MEDQVWLAGTGMTTFGPSPLGLDALAGAAARDALVDAGLGADDVDLVVFANALAGLLEGQAGIRGQIYLAETGLLGKAMINVENACASSSTAVAVAVNAVGSGMAEIAIAVGAEKMTAADRAQLFGAMAAGGTDTVRRPAEARTPSFMEHYAHKGAAYLDKAGGDVRDLAGVVVKSRAFAANNPNAQFRSPTSVDEVLAGRMIADPLRLAMCSPIGDGAAAVVVVSDRVAARLDRRQVRVAGIALVSADPGAVDPPTRRAATLAYTRAGIGPADVDVVEVHDAAAPAELFCLEDLDLCGEGEALGQLRDGVAGPGGRRPVNPSGGLLSRGHPVGATGCAQLVELVDQLRGRCGARQVPGARVALAQNAGGVLGGHEAAAVVTVLERR